MQCRGRRSNGETFLADVWFSTYQEGPAKKLAAIIGDISEDRDDDIGSQPVQLDLPERTPLNDREAAVLRLVLQGLPNREIASRLQISDSAVKNTLQQLFSKTEVRRRSQRVRVALERYPEVL